MSVFSAAISTAARPITAAEFYAAFRRAWKPKYENRVQTLGLAVSGGVDSMALAYLCQSMQELNSADRDGLDFRIRAFVVDHSARDGSANEAALVLKRLHRLRLKTRVLKMDWPQDSSPTKIANFESEARRLRYRLLGHACRERLIQSLLAAHHADDQAETVLVRLAMGHKSTGLQGIRQSADIPECWGIHGLYRSGGIELNTYPTHSSISSRTTGKPVFDVKAIPTECGGVSLYRPLLSFEKNRLVATCLAEGIEWVEDKTNQDPTLTIRNTARELLILGRLPVALQKPSMVELAKSAHSRVVQLEKSVERLLHTCDILSFDNRVGSLVVHLSEAVTSFNLSEPCTQEAFRKAEIEHLSSVSILLRRLMEPVSPLETVQLQSLQAAAKAVCLSKEMPMGFTAGGVRFQRSERTASELEGHSWQFTSTTTSEDSRPHTRRDTSDKQTVWTLSRQPYHLNTPPPTLLVPKRKATDTFVLWDGRFWIQLQNDASHDICVRPLRASDLAHELSLKFTQANRDLRAILHEAAPGDIRWTLPVIAFVDGVSLPDGQQRVLALPSLGITFGKHNSLIKWIIRYKKADLNLPDRKVEVVEKPEPNDIISADFPADTGVT